MNYNFKIFLTGIVLNITSLASVLDQHFVDLGGMGPDYFNRYTLTTNQTSLLSSTDFGIDKYAPLDAPCINTYDVMGWSIPIKFATNITLQPTAREKLKVLLGQEIPVDSTFQFIIQKSSSMDVERFDEGISNGGIEKGKQEPISFKAQYPYIQYAPKTSWYGTTIDEIPNVQSYLIAGNVTVNSVLIEDGTKLNYPERRVGLSIHSAGTSSTLSPDTLHLYRGDATPPATLDHGAPYPPADYDRLIKGENKTKAFMYKVTYDGWKKKLNTTEIPLKKEADRYGMIVMLSDADYDVFVKAIAENKTLRDAIQGISIFTGNINGIKLIDLLDDNTCIQNPPTSAKPQLPAQKKQQAAEKREAKRLRMLERDHPRFCVKGSKERSIISQPIRK